MHTKVLRGLRIRDTPILDQPHSLKLELPCKFPSLHDTPPVSSKHLTRCPRNRVQANRAVEHALHTRRSAWWNAPPMALSHFISFVYVCECLSKFPYQPEEVVALIDRPPTVDEVTRIRDELSAPSKKALSHERRTKGVLLSTEFVE